MSSSLRKDAVAKLIHYMGNRPEASKGIYTGHVRLLRKNISAQISPSQLRPNTDAQLIKALTLHPQYDDKWDAICLHMTKWAKSKSSTAIKQRWLMQPTTIQKNNREWSIKWTSNSRLIPSGKSVDIETTMKTAMSEEVVTAYIKAFDAFDEEFLSSPEYEHGIEREVSFRSPPPAGPNQEIPLLETGNFRTGVTTDIKQTNLKGQKGSYTDISIKKSMKEAVQKAMKMVGNFSAKDLICITDIFNGFLEHYLGGEHVLTKNRSSKGFNDTLEFIAEITLDDRANEANPGALNRAIRTAFINTFGGGGKVPSPEFVRLATRYAQMNDFSKIENLWAASDKPTKAIPKLAAGIIAEQLGSNKNIKLSSELKKLVKKRDKKRSPTVRNKGKRLKTTQRKTGRVGRPKKVRQGTQATTSHPIALKEMLNAVLPDEILKNMGSPALNNRTGRFRNSAQVTNALVGPRGGVQIEYTYQRNPYETFEPGGAQGSTGRDPRRLIGNTIREVAQEIMGKRFIRTRRV